MVFPANFMVATGRVKFFKRFKILKAELQFDGDNV